MYVTRAVSRTIRPIALALSGCLLCAASALSQEASVSDPEPDARAERVASRLLLPIQVRGRGLDFRRLDDRMKVHGVPAVSVAVIEGGAIQWARAWGVADVAAERAATTGTRFQAASISKPLAALAVLRLVESGRVGLDDDVGPYLNGWDVPRSVGVSGAVTPRGLLSHTAGLTVHGFGGYEAGTDVPTTLEVLEGSGPANSPPVLADRAPGSEWRYSGGGYTVGQHLVETVTERPFEVEMRDILDALGMESSTYAQPLPDSLASEAALGYREYGQPVGGRWHTYPERAAAGLWTTPTDLARYAIAVAGWLRGDTDGLLSPAMTELMLRPGLGDWGLGPSTAGEGLDFRFQHGGSSEGFRGEFVYFPSRGLGAAIMTNADGGSPLIQELLAAIAQEYDWPAYRPRVIRALELTASVGRQYAGRFQIEAAPDVDVRTRWRRGRLELQIGDASPSELVYVARDRFIVASDGADLRFERDVTGRVSAMIAYETRARRIRNSGGLRPREPLPRSLP